MSDLRVRPDPGGPPDPIQLFPEWFTRLGSAVSMATFMGGGLFLMAAALTPTCGARRSARLSWAEQQRQIEEAAARAAAPAARAAGPTDPKPH